MVANSEWKAFARNEKKGAQGQPMLSILHSSDGRQTTEPSCSRECMRIVLAMLEIQQHR
jgi:hypothetical protein